MIGAAGRSPSALVPLVNLLPRPDPIDSPSDLFEQSRSGEADLFETGPADAGLVLQVSNRHLAAKFGHCFL